MSLLFHLYSLSAGLPALCHGGFGSSVSSVLQLLISKCHLERKKKHIEQGFTLNKSPLKVSLKHFI